MSGIAAILHRDGRPATAQAVTAMLHAIPYRGPDGAGILVRDVAALGFARLALLPEDALERQPLESPRTGCVIVADARLDNREALLAALPDAPATGGDGSLPSDAALILRAFERWGADAPAHLLGDFAFAVWDPRARQVVCARDASGQRPLFYRLTAETFTAASEIHQLFQDAAIPLRPNEDRIVDYLTPLRAFRNDQEQPDTFFRGVKALPAGHVLVVDAAEGERLRRYWDLSSNREIRYRRDQEYVQHFGDLLVDAVRVRLRTTERAGALLSGGLDSASIVCLAALLGERGLVEPSRLLPLSLAFQGLECDEDAYIRDVEDKTGFGALRVPAASSIASFAAAPAGFMPMPAKAVGEIDLLLGEASRHGVRLVLSGHMADNCFGWSQQFFDSLLRRGRLGEFWRHLRAYRRAAPESLAETVTLSCLLPLLPLWAHRSLRAAHVRRSHGQEIGPLVPEWIAPETREALLARDLELRLDEERRRRFSSVERERIYQSLSPAEVLPISGAYPVQLARPFADRRIHEFVLAVPPEQLYEPHPYAAQFYAGSKLILRRAMLEILPESVRSRTRKTQFASLVPHELRTRWAEYASVFGPGGVSEVARRGVIQPEPFWRRLCAARAGDLGSDGVYLTRVLYLETWLRTFSLPRSRAVTVQPVHLESHPARCRRARPVSEERVPAAASEWSISTGRR